MATLTMYDTIEVSTVPPNPQAVAGYVGGRWPTYAELVARFPHAHHLSIAVNASERARCLDVEPGDATNAQAPGWFHNLADRSQGKPVFYTSASNSQALINTLESSGIHRDQYLLWSAHYTREHICGRNTCGFPNADGTQWNDKALGRNLDQSIINDYFFGVPKPPPPKAGGVANAVVRIDLAGGHWRVDPSPGHCTFGQDNVWWAAKVAVNYHTGEWRISSLPAEKNFSLVDAVKKVSPPKAQGIANAGVHIDLHSGRWTVNSLPGTGHVVLGQSNVWWQAKVAVNYHTGEWRISSLPSRQGFFASLWDKLLGR